MKENEFSDGFFVLFFVFFENILGLLKKVVPLSQYNQYTNLNKYK